MGDFLHLAWRRQTLGARLSGPIVQAARDAGYSVIDETETFWLGVGGPRPPALRSRQGDPLRIIGDVYDLAGLPGRVEHPIRSRYLDLCQTAWGRYVAFEHEADGRVRSLFRDPSGAFEAFVWELESLQVITSSTPDWLIAAARPSVRVRTGALADLIADPTAILGPLALDGVLACGAGDALDLVTRESLAVWRPRPQRAYEGSIEEAARDLEACVDRTTLRLSSGPGSALAELSGGLDSAIVSQALVRAGARVRAWVNSYTDQPETDERGYARLAASGLHAELKFMKRTSGHLTASLLEDTAGEPRPSLNGQDFAFDEDMARLCREAGVEALFTGKGGDAVFLHAVNGGVFADLWRAVGPAALLSPLLPALSRWTRVSASTIAREALRPRLASSPTVSGGGILVADQCSERMVHPWLHDLEHLGPAKRRHVAGVVGNLGFQTRCRRNAAVDMIHPLTAQPIVELCLSMPTWTLAAGGRDRGLARLAFAERVAPQIIERRSKGDYSAFFNREIAANLPFMRDYLLGGRLSALGVINRPGLEASLDPDRLIWKGAPAELSRALVVEAWIRRWERRSKP